MRSLLSAVAAALSLALMAFGTPVVAQHYGSNDGYGHQLGGANWAPSAFDWRSQLDRPGDYRCDAYWDANRNDCGAGWRDQRNRSSQAVRNQDYWNSGQGHRYDDSRYSYGGSRYGYPAYSRGYTADYGYGQASGSAYQGAYGRPDVVYPAGGRSHGYSGTRDQGRIDWCRHAYRSYDPASGYYRGYSGRLIFCG